MAVTAPCNVLAEADSDVRAPWGPTRGRDPGSHRLEADGGCRGRGADRADGSMGGGPEGTERPTDCTFHLCLLLETVTEVPPRATARRRLRPQSQGTRDRDRRAGREGLCSPVPEGVVRSPQGGQTGAEAVKPRLAIAAGPWRHVDPGSRGAERQPPAVPGASRPHVRTPHSSDLLPPGQLPRAEKSLSQFPFI